MLHGDASITANFEIRSINYFFDELRRYVSEMNNFWFIFPYSFCRKKIFDVQKLKVK